MSNIFPSVAVLLAAYNGSKWISEQLDSILSQEDVNVHIYISVDFSDDNTLDICSDYISKNNNISFISTERHFGSAAQNFFFLISSVDIENFDYVSFCDQDDIWFNNKLVYSIDTMLNKNCDAFSSNVIAFWEDGKTKLIKKSYKQVKFDYLFEAAGPGCTYVLSKKLALSLNFLVKANGVDFSKIYLHDWFFYAFARANHYSWHIDQSPTMYYRQHESNSVGVNDSVVSIFNRFKIVFNNLGFKQTLSIANLINFKNKKILYCLNNLSPFSLFYLSLYSFSCRRNFSDKLLFFIFCNIYSLKIIYNYFSKKR